MQSETADGAPSARDDHVPTIARLLTWQRGSGGQLNKTQPVHPKQPRRLNALGFSLPAAQQRAREPRPERPQRARPHARSTLCSNAVQARHAPATRQSPCIPALETQRPRRLLPEVAVYQSRLRSSRAATYGSAWGAVCEPLSEAFCGTRRRKSHRPAESERPRFLVLERACAGRLSAFALSNPASGQPPEIYVYGRDQPLQLRPLGLM